LFFYLSRIPVIKLETIKVKKGTVTSTGRFYFSSLLLSRIWDEKRLDPDPKSGMEKCSDPDPG
jgi:hypothetical protein